ncbi:hypothetical protein Fcan01_05263 [Folsomia candida]|uniref:Uncharacterized protein n=1 Tax=Folsomia candida TaxID=158441 RepID=A0A226EPQ3_FOLCA|nr:hypothetical protein Fcan01_05263 [Folsomia candida]
MGKRKIKAPPGKVKGYFIDENGEKWPKWIPPSPTPSSSIPLIEISSDDETEEMSASFDEAEAVTRISSEDDGNDDMLATFDEAEAIARAEEISTFRQYEEDWELSRGLPEKVDVELSSSNSSEQEMGSPVQGSSSGVEVVPDLKKLAKLQHEDNLRNFLERQPFE